MMTLYGIQNCDSCKKARRWLDLHQVVYRFHDYRIDGLSAELLQSFTDKLGFSSLLNRSSTSWRQLSADQQTDLTDEKAFNLILDIPTLLKRPILDTGKKLIIGFKSETYDSDL